MILPLLFGCFSGSVEDSGAPSGRDGRDGRDPGGDSGDSGDSGDTGEPVDTGRCGVTVSSTVPARNAVDAYYRANLEFKLNKQDPTATIETSIVGHQDVSDDGLTLYWVLDVPLEPSTGYSATLHFCGGDAPLEFTTSALGSSIADPVELEGRAYLLDLGGARVTEPPGIGSLIASELGNVVLYASITEVTATTFVMVDALGREDEANTQEYCDPTIEFPAADFAESPHFRIERSSELVIDLGGVPLTVSDMVIEGDFAADLSYFGGGSFTGILDTRSIDDVFFDGELGAVCTTLRSLGVTCEECTGSQPGEYCVPVAIDSVTADLAPLSVVAIEGTDCYGCGAGVPEDVSETCETEPPGP